jgi:GTP-binding protein HflX
VRTGAGIGELLERLAAEAELDFKPVHLRLPLDRYDLVTLMRREGKILAEEFTDDAIVVSAQIPERLVPALSETSLRDRSSQRE